MMGTPPDSRVYFIEDESTGLVKIGFSTNVRKRHLTTQVRVGRPLVILATVHGGRPLEKAVHKALEEDRRHGEWFAISDRLREFVNAARDSENEIPPAASSGRVPPELTTSFGVFAQAAAQARRQINPAKIYALRRTDCHIHCAHELAATS